MSDGSLSSCPPAEAVTWGKVDKDEYRSTCVSMQADYSTLMPFLTRALLEKRDRYARWEERMGRAALLEKHPQAAGYLRSPEGYRLMERREELLAKLMNEIRERGDAHEAPYPLAPSRPPRTNMMADEPDVEEELAPYKIESARSSRSRCRTCRRKIDKDTLRLGILLEGPYGTGYLWHHLTCAAKRRPEDVEAAYGEKAWDEGLKVPPLEELRLLKEKAEKKKAEQKEPPYVEHAPTGRAKCKHCGETIEKGSARVTLLREVTFGNQTRGNPINVHPGCVAAELRAEDCLTEAEDFAQALESNSRDFPPEALVATLEAIGEL